MTDVPPPRPGSRSERHQKGRRARRRVTSQAGTTPLTTRTPAPAAIPVRTTSTILPTPSDPVTIGSGRSDRRGWARTERRSRRRRIFAGLGVLIILGLVAGAALHVRRDRQRRQTAAEGVARTQRTLLVQVSGADRRTLASALVATDPATGRGSVMLLPARILTEVPGYGDSMLGKALEFGGPDLAAESTANLLGVLVDATWTISPAGLAGLVDAVGGVQVEVDTKISTPGAAGVDLKAGPQKLRGTDAAAYATFQGEEERELAKLPRMQSVLVGLARALPPPATAAKLLPGASSESSIGAAMLSKQLRLLAQADAANAVSYAVLPVSELEFGGDEVTYQLETQQVESLVGTNLAASMPESRFGRSNRVLLRNGVGTAAIGRSVTKKLLPAGFRVVGSANAPTFDYKKTVVLVFDESDKSIEVGRRVAEVLGLTEDAVQTSDINQSVADVIVIVGADYAS